jgi:hypothetical protein
VRSAAQWSALVATCRNWNTTLKLPALTEGGSAK